MRIELLLKIIQQLKAILKSSNKPSQVNAKKKNNTLTSKCKKRTIFTIVAIVNLIWYTIIVLILNYFDHTVQPELTVAWFSAWTVELGLLFGIKVMCKSDSNESESQESDSSKEESD